MWDGLVEALRMVVRGDPEVLHAVYVSLVCTLTSVTLASLVAMPYGAWLGLYRPRFGRAQVFLLRVGMSVPTVVIGLVIFGLLSRSGPLGGADLLYSKSAIIIGEFLLAFPLAGSLAHGATVGLDRRIVETALTLGASRSRALLTVLDEIRSALSAAILATFGRCITELGIAITVGGNLLLSTRTLPSTIQHELGRGDFGGAVAPGIVLLALAALTAAITQWLAREARE